MKPLFGLTDSDRQKIITVFNAYPKVEKAILYGSRAKGNYKPSSDIDLTIIGNLDWQTFNQLEVALDELLLPYQIDLSIFSQIDNPALIDHIKRIGKNFYEK